ncbi:hypothetical protein [Paenibacillus graminis]|uniref:Uncharacterized protein n=2 Tax=Paenibacillus graminis TaxID=189425 RepID=A0A089M8C2_9BACL|nr:hypothetical protein [Paenibacillus graminis]AIQ69487.1 hypothetical protein PGRAT_18945 [Paenibacillus graminis]
MSEAGKVSLPTPGQIEEIRLLWEEGYTFSTEIGRFAPQKVIGGLLAALEEAQQQAQLAYAAYEDLQGYCVSRREYDFLLNKHSVLARAHQEAQQTIARQREALIATGLPEWAVNAIGSGEGETQP